MVEKLVENFTFSNLKNKIKAISEGVGLLNLVFASNNVALKGLFGKVSEGLLVVKGIIYK